MVIDHIRIIGIELELACNGGSCGEISLKRGGKGPSHVSRVLKMINYDSR